MTTLRVLHPDGVWRGVGLPDLSRSRDQLEVGTYMPSARTTGPTVSTFTDVYASPGSNQITLTVPGGGNDPEVLAGGTPVGSVYEGVKAHRFWGRVRPGAEGIHLRDFLIAGPDPLTVTAPNAQGCVQNYGSNPPFLQMTDGAIDTRLWGGEPYNRAGNSLVYGIHGGNFRALRVEIAGGSDGVAFQGPNGSLAAARAARTEMLGCWVHAAFYENDFYPSAAANDGQMHQDGFQFTYGKHVTIRGSLFGGVRVVEGYVVWPGGWNAGDDHWNSEFMIRQTTSVDPIYLIEDVLIERNWLSGGTATINHVWDSSRPNSFESMAIRDNLFMFREADWGFKMRGDGPGLPGYRNDTPRPGGYYVIRTNTPNLRAVYERNTIATLNLDGSWHDTGIPVPISNG